MTHSIFKQAVQEAKQSNYSKALDLFTRTIREQPNNYAGYLNRGTIRLSTNQFHASLQDFSKAISLQPYQITAYYNRFIVNYKVGHKIQSQKDLYVALSLSYAKRGEELQSMQLFNKALSLVQNNALAYLKRGNLHQKQDNFLGAESDYSTALQYDEAYVPALSARASLYKLHNKQQESQNDVQLIAELTKQYYSQQVVLQPKVQQLEGKQLQLDIQNKLKEFASLRFQLFHLSEEPLSSKNIHLEAKKQIQNQSFGIFNSFNESSNNGSTNQNITNKGIQEEKVSVSLKSNESSHGSHITEKSEEYKIESGSSFKQPGSRFSIQQPHIPQEQLEHMESLVVAPYSKLQIKVSSGVLTRDTEMLGSMSPYIVCEYNGWVQNSQVSSGKNPEWNETFTFNYVEQTKNISFKVYDKETFKEDDLIGETDILIKHLVNLDVLKVYYSQEEVGILNISASMLRQ